MENPTPNTNWIAMAIAAIAITLFFIPTPSPISNPWLAELWNLGHVFTFALLTRLLAPWISVSKRPPLKTIFWILFLMLSAGAAIELIQSLLSREASLHDLTLDMVGAGIGIMLYRPFRQALLKYPRAVMIFTTAAFLYSIWPFSVLTLDSAIAHRQYPTLIDFSSPFEITRVSGSASFQKQENQLAVTFTSKPYSTLHVQRFHPDWSNHTHLNIECFLKGIQPLRIQVSIEDDLHGKTGYELSDRFTRIYELEPGYNRLRIILSDIRSAPANRSMDLNSMNKINLYTMQLESERSITLNRIYLTNLR